MVERDGRQGNLTTMLVTDIQPGDILIVRRESGKEYQITLGNTFFDCETQPQVVVWNMTTQKKEIAYLNWHGVYVAFSIEVFREGKKIA